MSAKLLKNSKLVKLRSYFCHAGFDAGVVNLQRGEIKGLPAGTYLNIYVEPNVIAAQGDTTRLNEYYSWLLGEENWHIVKQVLAFMLNAKTEKDHNGIKIQWYLIIHAVD